MSHKFFVERRGLRNKFYAFCPCGWQSLGQDNRVQAELKGSSHLRTVKRREEAAKTGPQAAP